MKKRIVVTTTMVARMRALRAAGTSYEGIARELGVSSHTVMRHLSEHHAARQKMHERNRFIRDREKRQALSREIWKRNHPKAE